MRQLVGKSLMALRMMQIFLSETPGADLDDLLEGLDILGRWEDVQKSRTLLHLLVPADESESVMDRLEAVYSKSDGFHVVLSSVEAVLPRKSLEEPEEEQVSNVNESGRVSREELYAMTNEGIGISRVFIGLTVCSAVVAAVGLLRDDVAVIIGAMVMAPLLGPNVAMSLSITLGDLDLLQRSLRSNLVGVVSTLLVALIIGSVFKVDASTPAIAARTSVGFGDILLALAAGTAGTMAFTCGLSGAVIGVMVAVALVPPLVNAGILLGNGETTLGAGALLVVGTNVICINLAGICTFLLQGVRPRTWWEEERAKSSTRIAISIWIVLLLLLVLILSLNGVVYTI